MGIFSFLKKDKPDDKPQESGLPPLPPMPEGQGFGDMPPIRSEDADMPPPEMPSPPGMSMDDDDMPPLPGMPEQEPEQPEMPPAPQIPAPESPSMGMPPPEPQPMVPPPMPEQVQDVMDPTIPQHTEEPPRMGGPSPSLFPKGPIRPDVRSNIIEEPTESPEDDMSSEGHEFPDQFVETPKKESKKPDFPGAFHLGEEHTEDVGDRPLFVRADLYGEVLDNTDEIKKSLREAEEVLFRSKALRQEMNKEYQKWHDRMEDIQRKLVLIDQSLFE